MTPNEQSISRLTGNTEKGEDDLTLLSKDVHADSKREASNRFLQLREELDKQTVDGHVKLSNMGLELSASQTEGEPIDKLLVPTPLHTPAPKSDTFKTDSTLYIEDVIYNNYRENFLNNIDNFYVCSSCNKT